MEGMMMMKLDRQITDRMKELAQAEREAAFRHYTERAWAKCEKLAGEVTTNKEEILPFIKQAYDKGIMPERLGELLAQAQEMST
jgi:hypothetical protein